jgi:hypothetical protein
MRAADFAKSLPRGAVGELGPVPNATMPPTEISLREQNKEVMRKFWAAREHDPFRRRPTIEGGIETYHSTIVPPPPALPQPEVSVAALVEARAGLRRALEMRAEAQRVVDDAGAAVERGHHATDEARGRLAGTGDPDSQIAIYKAGCAKAGKPDRPLPAALERQRTEHDRAARELADAENAARILESDRGRARQVFDTADQTVCEAVARCVDHRAALLAYRMVALQCEAFQIRQSLVALSGLGIHGRVYRVPTSVSAALARDPTPWTGTPPTARTALLADWQKRVAQLLLDPDCDLGDSDG